MPTYSEPQHLESQFCETESEQGRRGRSRLFVILAICSLSFRTLIADEPLFEGEVQSILMSKCISCHGADRGKLKAELDLRNVKSMLQGGESGPAVVPEKPELSLIWTRVNDGQMPPSGSEPLTNIEREKLKSWITSGARSKRTSSDAKKLSSPEVDFWSFRHLKKPVLPAVVQHDQVRSPLDQFILARLEQQGMEFSIPADPRMLIRRVYLDLIGLPPTPANVRQFLERQDDPNAYSELVDQLLSSSQYGERWGRQWLDVAGYADSNGYIRHDSLRPLAWRYRDYVVQSFNQDKPYDQFWLEQLAGDELVKQPVADSLTEVDLSRLTATHFLRNAPDGTDNTEGNETTRVMERYAVLESQLQITMSAMFGMTIECARCHSHKFDPIPQRDYYALQAIFYPAFNVKQWTPPKDRWIYAAGQADLTKWRTTNAEIEQEITKLRSEFAEWVKLNRPPATVLFRDDFSAGSVKGNWSDTAPGDDTTAGLPAVQLDGQTGPAVHVSDNHLAIVAGGASDSVWLSTKQSFDWTPDRIGDWIQVTFDLMDIHGPGGTPAERIGFYIALLDHNDSSDTLAENLRRGNILIDGNPAGASSVIVDYPGQDQQSVGAIGKAGYASGHNYGVRVTRSDADRFLIEHLIDGHPEVNSLFLTAAQIPDGAFGFELCCSRSFQVDNVVVECSSTEASESSSLSYSSFAVEVPERQKQLDLAIAAAEHRKISEPDKVAFVTDLTDQPPQVPLLKRGDYFQHGPFVEPGPLSVLMDSDNAMPILPSPVENKSTGRRLAFAKWATRPGSRAAALLARVEADRLWRGHFGRGLVPTPENFGASGLPPTNPELLEWLAAELVENGWSLKSLHRQIVLSRTYQQSSVASDRAVHADPDNLLYSRFPAHRIDAEQMRDSMLAAAGVLNLKQGGPSIGVIDVGNRQVDLPPPDGPGPHEVHRRSIYVQQRRSQPLTLLQFFDQGAPEPACVTRSTSTVVAQSLALINGEFAVRMGRAFAERIFEDNGAEVAGRVVQAFEIAFARGPDETELARCIDFIQRQSALWSKTNPDEAQMRALRDFCRMLLASNEFSQLQ